MDYDVGIRLDAINEKLDYLIQRLREAEEKANNNPKGEKTK